MAVRKLTEMSRRRFFEIMTAMMDGSMDERWPEGKVPETRAEKVEERQIRAIGMIYDGEDEGEELRKLLKSKSWSSLELLLDEDKDIVRIHVFGRRRR